MSLDALLMLVGALVAVMPFLGFTVDMQQWIIFILGIIVIALGIAVRRRGARQLHARRRGEFVESDPADAIRHSTRDNALRDNLRDATREDDSING